MEKSLSERANAGSVTTLPRTSKSTDLARMNRQTVGGEKE